MTPARVRLTYFVEVLSSWCHWAEPTWAELQRRYAGVVDFRWKIALMPPAAFPTDRAQCDRFYQRSGAVVRSPYMLHSGWFDPALQGDYSAPNYVAEAARALGGTDDRVRLALAHAALREGRPIGQLDEAVAVAAEVLAVAPGRLREAALSAPVRAAVTDSTAAFHDLQIDQRPAFVLESAIGDKAVFSGLTRLEPLAATIEAMRSDVDGYASHHAHHGIP